MDAPPGAAAAAAACKQNVYRLSVVFFLVYTAFSGIQSLEASIIGGHCRHCDAVCWAGGAACRDAAAAARPDPAATMCMHTDGSGQVYCAQLGGACGGDCPNGDAGGLVEVGNATPAFEPCGGSSNVGAVCMAALYAVFTVCCLVGGRVADRLGTKRAIVLGMSLITVFCAANFVVALAPASTALQYALLLPASALVGVAAAVLWPAQGVFVTSNSAAYAAARGGGGADASAALGSFFGIFFGFHQSTQITGNLVAGVLLEYAGLSVAWLMLVYTGLAAVGTCVAATLLPDAAPAEEGPGKGAHPCAEALSMTRMWRDRRLLLLIPTFAYAGVGEAFAWGVFTSSWVKTSVGVANIGYVMAVFGACDVVSAVALGRLSDRLGRFPVITVGALCNLAVLLVLKNVDVEACDRQWGMLVGCAGLWGVADAVWVTQLSCLMGEMFPGHKEDAFANLKLWQSVATAALFALGFDRTLLTPGAWLNVVLVALVVGYATCSNAYRLTGFRPPRPGADGAPCGYGPVEAADAVDAADGGSDAALDTVSLLSLRVLGTWAATIPLDVWHHDNAKAMPRGDARMEVLETRMADPQQQAIRDKVLCDPGTGRCVLRGRVLDVGCGTGALLRWAVAAAGGEITEAVGVDPSPAMVEYAARRAEEALPGAGYKVEVGYAPATDGGWQKRLVYAEGSALDLRGRYGLFDHVVFWTCLSHIPIARHDAVFDEVRRCLMPGGTLHVFDNDMAAREIVTTLGDGDPLATVYKHYVNEVVYKDAKYLMRALPGALCNQYGFCAQGAVRPLEVHNVTYNAAAGADGRVNYGYHNLLRALDGYAKWADGRVGEAFIAALKDEAARRAGRGELLMVFAYAYLRVVMPEEG